MLAYSTLESEALRSARTHKHDPVTILLQFYFGLKLAHNTELCENNDFPSKKHSIWDSTRERMIVRTGLNSGMTTVRLGIMC